MAVSEAGKLSQAIAAELRRRAFQAYLVGGCVRDLLLGVEPKDYDIATDATPAELARIFPGSRMVGAQFGVVLIGSGEASVEVATFRSDHTYRDGRRPEGVTFETEAAADVRRRDFTINALLLDPESGDVIDLVGGQADLRDKLVRTVGEPAARFQEDRLRMLRAVRFAARLGFRLEARTEQAIRDSASLIQSVSAERVRDELVRILTEGSARRGVELMDSTGLLVWILPEVAALKGVEQPPQFHPEGDVWIHTLLMLEKLQSPTPTLAMGALLHDVGKPPTFSVAERIRFDRHAGVGAEMAENILRRLRFSNRQVEQVRALVNHHLRFKDVREMRESTLRRFLRVDRFEEHLELHRLDCAASHGQMDTYAYVQAKLNRLSKEALRPPRLLTGHDLIAAGYEPGPAFATMLEAVETAQLESRVATREQALSFLLEQFLTPDGRPRLAGK